MFLLLISARMHVYSLFSCVLGSDYAFFLCHFLFMKVFKCRTSTTFFPHFPSQDKPFFACRMCHRTGSLLLSPRTLQQPNQGSKMEIPQWSRRIPHWRRTSSGIWKTSPLPLRTSSSQCQRRPKVRSDLNPLFPTETLVRRGANPARRLDFWRGWVRCPPSVVAPHPKSGMFDERWRKVDRNLRGGWNLPARWRESSALPRTPTVSRGQEVAVLRYQ